MKGFRVKCNGKGCNFMTGTHWSEKGVVRELNKTDEAFYSAKEPHHSSCPQCGRIDTLRMKTV